MSLASVYGEQLKRTAMFEAIEQVGKQETVIPPANQKSTDEMLFEAIEQAAVTNYRAGGMSAVLAWVETGEPSADDFDMTAFGMADINEDGDVTEEEEEEYNEILFAMTQALAHMQIDEDDINDLLEGDDKAAERVYTAVGEYVENSDDSEAEIIATFSVAQEAMTEAKKKVVRDGKIVWVKKPLRKKRISAKQRAALKRARMKANTGAAKAKRAKAMKKRKAAGL